MPDEEQNGHDPNQDLPQMEASGASAGAGGGSDPRYQPGLGNFLIQPNAGRGFWDPIERFMKGSASAEEFLPLTNVTTKQIARDTRIMFSLNVAKFGNGRLREVMWNRYQLQRALNGKAAEQVVEMVTGNRQGRTQDWQGARKRIFERSRSNNPMADNAQRLNAGE